MFWQFSPQCCDAQGYLDLGRRCFAEGECWDRLRPLGMTLYASLPYRLGLPQEALILFNLGLLAVSIALAARFIGIVWPATRRSYGWVRYVTALLPHLVFMWTLSFNSLSDGPAAAMALSGLWLTCTILVERRGPATAAAAGLLTGLSAFLRLSYLYPALMLGAVFVTTAIYRRHLQKTTTAVFLAALVVPLCVQVSRTHAHTGVWSYIDSATNSSLMSEHLNSTLYGYDTVVPAWQGPGQQPQALNPDLVILQQGSAVGYDARSCFRGSLGLMPALKDGDLAGAACLLAMRESFYFGSYATLGAVYLPSPASRIWSRWLYVVNGLPLALTLSWILTTAQRRAAGTAAAFAVSLWFVATIALPEQRFFVPVSVFTWVVGISAPWSWFLCGKERTAPTFPPNAR